MKAKLVTGNLLDQKVDAIVNPWNRNMIPWWLLLPQGVSGAIKKQAGYAPFKELRKHGILPLGAAVKTNAGKLPFKAIIHVAGINHFWVSSEKSIRKSVSSALKKAKECKFNSIAFPLIGAGTGGFSPEKVERFITHQIAISDFTGQCTIVRFRPNTQHVKN